MAPNFSDMRSARRLLRRRRMDDSESGPELDRPRERLVAYGADRLSNEELIALVLGTGARGASATEVAQKLLAHAGGLLALSRSRPGEIASCPGLGRVRAGRIAAAFQLGRRAVEAAALPGRRVRGAEDVFYRLRARMAGLAQEIFIALALDSRNVIVDEIEVARGCLTAVEVHPREVFRPLIRQGAAAAVVAHNHPSGSSVPSQEDLDLTRRLRQVGDLVGIPILDHVVIGRNDYCSIAEILG
jgi:DNA repair protein RadC